MRMADHCNLKSSRSAGWLNHYSLNSTPTEVQLDAIESVVKLFEGLPRHASDFALGGEIVPNLPPSNRSTQHGSSPTCVKIQQGNEIHQEQISFQLEVENAWCWKAPATILALPNFTIEMETGTGKTYVYLRTIYELRQRFGFSKFIIVVPSIAIYEA